MRLGGGGEGRICMRKMLCGRVTLRGGQVNSKNTALMESLLVRGIVKEQMF